MNSKVIIAAIVGAIFYFLLGWLLYGILLADTMEAGMTDSMKAIYRASDGYIYWGFLASNLASALLLAIICNRNGSRSFGKGALTGLWVGFLTVAAFDFGMYAQTTLFEPSMIAMDLLMGSIMSALLGGVVGLMLGMGKKKEATV